jgi:hypothetical protein
MEEAAACEQEETSSVFTWLRRKMAEAAQAWARGETNEKYS